MTESLGEGDGACMFGGLQITTGLDFDGDGLPDGTEINWFMSDPLFSDPDSDQDGWYDWVENAVGSNANDPNDLPDDVNNDGIADMLAGPQGPRGDQGVQGIKGDKGVQGVQGVKGNKGNKGDRGVRGPVGPVDERAYNVAMDTKSEVSDLAARTAAAEATAAAALAKASMPPRLPRPRRRRRRRRWWCDMRLKENIVQIGLSETNIPIYTYTYKDIMDKVEGIDISKTYKGVIAQDLLELGFNDAVKSVGGIYTVDYNKIDVNFEIL